MCAMAPTLLFITGVLTGLIAGFILSRVFSKGCSSGGSGGACLLAAVAEDQPAPRRTAPRARAGLIYALGA